MFIFHQHKMIKIKSLRCEVVKLTLNEAHLLNSRSLGVLSLPFPHFSCSFSDLFIPTDMNLPPPLSLQ